MASNNCRTVHTAKRHLFVVLVTLQSLGRTAAWTHRHSPRTTRQRCFAKPIGGGDFIASAEFPSTCGMPMLIPATTLMLPPAPQSTVATVGADARPPAPPTVAAPLPAAPTPAALAPAPAAIDASSAPERLRALLRRDDNEVLSRYNK